MAVLATIKTTPGGLLQEIELLCQAQKYRQAAELLAQISPEESGPPNAKVAYLRALTFHHAGEYRQALAAARETLGALSVSSDHDLVAKTQYVIGDTYLALGDLKNAELYLRDSVSHFRRVENHRGRAQGYNELARVAFIQADFPRALDMLSEALEACQLSGDEMLRAKIMGNFGRVYTLMGRWEEAERYVLLGLLLNEHLGIEVSICRNLLSLGYLFFLRGRWDEAAEQYQKALRLIEKNDFRREWAIYFEYAGDLAAAQGKTAEAERLYREGLAIGEAIAPDSTITSQIGRRLAELSLAQGNLSLAADQCQRALDLAATIGEKSEIGACYRVLGAIAGLQGEPGQAKSYLAHALTVLDECGDRFELVKTCLAACAFVLEHLSDLSLTHWAVQVLSQGRDTARALGLREETARFTLFEIEYLCRREEFDRAQKLLQSTAGEISSAGLSVKTDFDALVARLNRALVEHGQSPRNSFRFLSFVNGNGAQAAGASPGELFRFAAERLQAHYGDLREAQEGRLGQPLVVVGILPDETEAQTGCDLSLPLLVNCYSGNGVNRLEIPLRSGDAVLGRIQFVREASLFTQEEIDFACATAELLALKLLEESHQKVLDDNRRLREALQSTCAFPNVITAHAGFTEMLKRLDQVKDSTLSLLLEGETGTGKDLLAKAIHYSSARRDKPFVSVNCAALPETLLESELFGHRKGAYTGADRDKIGLFAEADGGTFYLDEVSELPPAIQVKLLRVLEEKEVTRLGDTRPQKVDVRVISAGNKDLKTQMEKELFRADLYYRLCTLTFKLPPLRERKEDLPLLVEHFVKKHSPAGATTLPRIDPAFLRLLTEYDWPGNVRELENEIRKVLLLLGEGTRLTPDLLSGKFFGPDGDGLGKTTNGSFSLYEHISQFERRYLLKALSENRWIKKRAASALQIPESTLRVKMKQYGLQEEKETET